MEKKIVFISGMAFDANVSIIKCLKDKYDVYYMPICNSGVYNRIGTFDMPDDIVRASNIAEFKKLGDFLDLDKTFLLRHYSFKELGLRSIVKKLKLDLRIHKQITRLNPVAVICDTYDFPLTRFHLKNKILLFKHDPFPHSGEQTILRKIMDWSLNKCAARYVLFNVNQKEQFINYFRIKSEKVFVSFLSIYEFLHLYDKPDKQQVCGKNIFFWGRISKYKGIDYLIDGFKKYIDQTGDRTASLTIAGDGIWYFDIDAAVERYSQITVVKRFLSMNELVNFIKDSYMVVCPYTDATQSGVIMSAFAMRKPVLATNVGGLPEMLDNGKTGMLIEPKNSDSICNAIKYLYQHPQKMDEYINNIEKIYFVNGKKSWNEGVKGISNAIESL